MTASLKADSSQELLDPVTAYERLAPYYADFCRRRAAYLRSVEEQIRARIPSGAGSLLDIAAGDGSRARRIASAAGISRVVLLEPSLKMLEAGHANVETWRVRAEDLDPNAIHARFDVITCLWNVLGHIPDPEKRERALGVAAELLSPRGALFLDVIHRYNVRSYGAFMTAARWARDHLAPGSRNGDVAAHWQTTAGEISTYGHVFTDSEVRRLAESAGLEVLDRVVIDYKTGAIKRVSCMGNLLYVLRCAS